MARPSTRDGWIQTAYELDAALAFADFSKNAQTVLRYVFAQTFGQYKRRTAEIDQAEIARRTGQKQPNISRAVRELVEAKVLTRVGKTRFKFQKDYEQWLRGEKPRLTETEVADAKGAPMHARQLRREAEEAEGHIDPDKSGHIDRDKSHIDPDKSAYRSRYGGDIDPDKSAYRSRYGGDIDPDKSGTAPPGPPYKEARARVPEEKEEKKSVCEIKKSGNPDTHTGLDPLKEEARKNREAFEAIRAGMGMIGRRAGDA